MSNIIIITARIVRDIDMKFSANGKAFAIFTIAWNTGRGDNQKSHFLDGVCFGAVAEKIANRKKGEMITVSGEIQMNSWTANDGTKRNKIQVIAEAVYLDTSEPTEAQDATSVRVDEQDTEGADDGYEPPF